MPRAVRAIAQSTGKGLKALRDVQDVAQNSAIGTAIRELPSRMNRGKNVLEGRALRGVNKTVMRAVDALENAGVITPRQAQKARVGIAYADKADTKTIESRLQGIKNPTKQERALLNDIEANSLIERLDRYSPLGTTRTADRLYDNKRRKFDEKYTPPTSEFSNSKANKEKQAIRHEAYLRGEFPSSNRVDRADMLERKAVNSYRDAYKDLRRLASLGAISAGIAGAGALAQKEKNTSSKDTKKRMTSGAITKAKITRYKPIRSLKNALTNLYDTAEWKVAQSPKITDKNVNTYRLDALAHVNPKAAQRAGYSPKNNRQFYRDMKTKTGFDAINDYKKERKRTLLGVGSVVASIPLIAHHGKEIIKERERKLDKINQNRLWNEKNIKIFRFPRTEPLSGFELLDLTSDKHKYQDFYWAPQHTDS